MMSSAANNTSIKISSEESGVSTNTITLVADNNIFLDGPINLNKQNVNVAGTTIITKNIVFITADVAGIVLDLGSTLISPIGRQVIIKRDHATNVNSVQITSSIIGHTIEGAASYNITGVRESITLVYNDTTNNWNII